METEILFPCTSKPSSTGIHRLPSCCAKDGVRAGKSGNARWPTSRNGPKAKSTPCAVCCGTNPLAGRDDAFEIVCSRPHGHIAAVPGTLRKPGLKADRTEPGPAASRRRRPGALRPDPDLRGRTPLPAGEAQVFARWQEGQAAESGLPCDRDGCPVALSLFDGKDLVEVHSDAYPGERLMVCRNPLLAGERARRRETLPEATEKLPEPIAAATRREKRRLRGKTGSARGWAGSSAGTGWPDTSRGGSTPGAGSTTGADAPTGAGLCTASAPCSPTLPPSPATGSCLAWPEPNRSRSSPGLPACRTKPSVCPACRCNPVPGNELLIHRNNQYNQWDNP